MIFDGNKLRKGRKRLCLRLFVCRCLRGSVFSTVLSVQAEKQADMPLNQIYNLILALRFAVAEIEPDGNGQAELSRHDFRVIARQLFLLY